ncbi:MAG: hypothetical protein ACH350_00325 [Parachlamydiaceae bacterium]
MFIPNSRYQDINAYLYHVEEELKSSKKQEDLGGLCEITGKAIQSVKKEQSLWTMITSFFSRLFGRVSDYEKLQIRADQLERKLVDLIDGPECETTRQLLDQTKKEVKEAISHLNEDIAVALLQLEEVDHYLNGLSRTKFRSPEEVVKLIEDASYPAATLKILGPFHNRIVSNYQDDDEFDLSLIKKLDERFVAIKEKQLAIQQNLMSQLFASIETQKSSKSARSELIGKKMPGGICNGGNTCYLASGLQVMRATAAYRNAMDPELNPLKKREKETNAVFQHRKLVQKKGDEILQAIEEGKQVSRETINQFRKCCYECPTSQGKRVVDHLSRQADAAEVLERLLDVVDFDAGYYQINEQRVPVDQRFEILPRNAKNNPDDYSSLNELAQGKVETCSATVEVAAAQYLNGSVPMQRLIDERWGKESLSDVKVADWDEKGFPCVKKFNSMHLKKKVNTQVELPEVIRITVKQSEFYKANLTDADEIYPFGSRNGDKYRLVALIEHRPGHYVAHTRGGDGKLIEANDSWVHRGEQEVGGFVYYYVKEPKFVQNPLEGEF